MCVGVWQGGDSAAYTAHFRGRVKAFYVCVVGRGALVPPSWSEVAHAVHVSGLASALCMRGCGRTLGEP